jgi:chemotaxis protein CheY-P-specific phosphatase CheC
MSSSMTSERLSAVVTELLESAVFVFAEPVEIKPWDDSTVWCARLDLEHGKKFQMSLCAPKELALTLAANLLGLEPDSAEAQESLGDAVGEMANMLAGTVAVELFGKDVVCRIGVPKVTQGSGTDHDAFAAKAVCRSSLLTEEGHRIDACLFEGEVDFVVAASAATADKTPTPTGDDA